MKPSPTYISICSLIALVVIPFGRICFQDFTWWDDDITIHHNLAFDPPTLRDTFAYWQHPANGMYVPVAYTAWGLLAFIAWKRDLVAFGINLNPGVYHLASLMAHLATTLVVFGILRRLVRRDWAALAGAALYGVHPMQVETVAWATALKEGLCGLFGMISIWCYLIATAECPSLPDSDGQECPPQPEKAPQKRIEPSIRRRLAFYALALVCLVLAQLSNPLAVVVPVMAFVIDWMMLRRPLRKTVIQVAPLLLVSIPCAVIAKLVQPGAAAPAIPFWARPLVAGDTVAFYLYKLVFPLHVATDYGRRPDLALARGWLYWTWLVPVVVGCAAIVLGRKRRWIWAGALLFVAGVGPVLGFVPFDLQQFTTPADRYMVLSMLGPALIVAAGFSAGAARWQKIAWAMIVVVLAVRSGVQCGVWRDDLTLWRHTAAVSPDSYLAHNNLGAAWLRLGRAHAPQAADEFAESVRINPEAWMGHANLASTLLRFDGPEDRVMHEVDETVRLQSRMPPEKRPLDSEMFYKLGTLLLARNRPAEAVVYLQRALEMEPNDPAARSALEKARSKRMTTRPGIETVPTSYKR